MLSIWMTVECFVVVKYLLSLNVHPETFLIAYVLFSGSVKLFSHRISFKYYCTGLISNHSVYFLSHFTSYFESILFSYRHYTLALAFIAWKSETSPVSLMENV